MSSPAETTTIVCVHEDRVECLVGVKLTVLSLIDWCPDLPVIISCPRPPASFRNWAAALANVQVVSYPEFAGRCWNVKPAVLLRLLEEGYREVMWIDSDIIVTRNFRERMPNIDDKTLVVTQECYWEEQYLGSYRTIAWGLKPDRVLPALVNTGIVRVTPQHTRLLNAWKSMLDHPAYLQAQQLPDDKRPRHMYSDQEALTALLNSTEFSYVPVRMLKRGRDIAQCIRASGYTPLERLRSLRSGLPALIHSMYLPKPWNRGSSSAAIWRTREPLVTCLRRYFFNLYLELSPYLSIARKYRTQIGEDATWMDMKSSPAKLFAILFAHHPALQGFPLALLESGLRRVSRLFKRESDPLHSDFTLANSPFHSNPE